MKNALKVFSAAALLSVVMTLPFSHAQEKMKGK
ncbi:hypothetical protein BDW_10390 [Bdellovibrio bacteriovorus W]|nr:hypothetical protein BDW_10390 [Bdellovibrio bacteriovorus W]